MHYKFIIVLLIFLLTVDVQAQTRLDTVNNFELGVPVRRRIYLGNGLDFAMLSTSLTTTPGRSNFLSIPRFTALVNFGFTVNYDRNRRWGVFTGFGLRNMGFIEKVLDSTIKRRVYSLGIPLGIKIGDLRNRNFFLAGGGLDIPFHFREKGFLKRNEKSNTSEWLSNRTPVVMPFVFAGYSFDPGVTLKLQYYPGNFLNPSFEYQGTYPYAGYKVHLLLLSLGLDIHYNQYKIQQREYLELKREREQTRSL